MNSSKDQILNEIRIPDGYQPELVRTSAGDAWVLVPKTQAPSVQSAGEVQPVASDKPSTSAARRKAARALSGLMSDTEFQQENVVQTPIQPVDPSSTKDKVVRAGAAVFAEKGFHNATKEDIGKRAGYSHQTVRDHFRVKEEMLLVILDGVWHEISSAMRPTQKNEKLARRAMRAYETLALLSVRRAAEVTCLVREARTAGPNSGPLQTQTERELYRSLSAEVSRDCEISETTAEARVQAVFAAMFSLVPSASGAVHGFSEADGRNSFAVLAESLLGTKG